MVEPARTQAGHRRGGHRARRPPRRHARTRPRRGTSSWTPACGRRLLDAARVCAVRRSRRWTAAVLAPWAAREPSCAAAVPPRQAARATAPAPPSSSWRSPDRRGRARRACEAGADAGAAASLRRAGDRDCRTGVEPLLPAGRPRRARSTALARAARRGGRATVGQPRAARGVAATRASRRGRLAAQRRSTPCTADGARRARARARVGVARAVRARSSRGWSRLAGAGRRGRLRTRRADGRRALRAQAAGACSQRVRVRARQAHGLAPARPEGLRVPGDHGRGGPRAHLQLGPARPVARAAEIVATGVAAVRLDLHVESRPARPRASRGAPAGGARRARGGRRGARSSRWSSPSTSGPLLPGRDAEPLRVSRGTDGYLTVICLVTTV